MTTDKECITCGRAQTADHFQERRNVCTACKVKKARARISESYESYLRNIYAQSKSTWRMGRRSVDMEFTITKEDVVGLWDKQEGRCAISGVFLTHHKDGSGTKEYNASIDRISGEKGYIYQNVQLVAYRINIMKHTLPEDMLYWWVKTIHDFSCD